MRGCWRLDDLAFLVKSLRLMIFYRRYTPQEVYPIWRITSSEKDTSVTNNQPRSCHPTRTHHLNFVVDTKIHPFTSPR